jgi:hypoxanthine phosphoribosyltransferase
VSDRPRDPEVLIAARPLRARIGELGAEIARAYAARPSPPIAVGILKGSAIFLADLVRALDVDVEVDFMSISAYDEADQGSGIVRILKDLECDVSGRDVLVVEDIVDTGLTLSYLRRTITARGATSLATVTLLDKAARRIVPVPVEYAGFEVPDVFVVGYGLDWRGRFRNLHDIVALEDAGGRGSEALLQRRYAGGAFAGDG